MFNFNTQTLFIVHILQKVRGYPTSQNCIIGFLPGSTTSTTSASGLAVKFKVAIFEPPVRLRACAISFFAFFLVPNCDMFDIRSFFGTLLFLKYYIES